MALPGEAGRHHDLGALGRPEAGRHLPGRGDELVQPLRLWRDRRLDVPRDGGHRDRRRRPATSTSSSSRGPAAGSRASRPATRRCTAGSRVRPGRWQDGKFELAVDVPANTRATVRLPKAQLAGVTEGGQPLAAGTGISGPKQDGDAVVVEVGSGSYRFAYPHAGLMSSTRVVALTGAGHPGGRRGRTRAPERRPTRWSVASWTRPPPRQPARVVALDERQRHPGRHHRGPGVDEARGHRRRADVRRQHRQHPEGQLTRRSSWRSASSTTPPSGRRCCGTRPRSATGWAWR